MHTCASAVPVAVAEPVVLVHGFLVSSRYMEPLATLLAPHRTVYAPDLPGFGQSEKPPEVLDIPGMADALVAWMDVVGLARAAFVGNSLGCQAVIDLAARFPARISRAVLVGPTPDPRFHTMLGQLKRLLIDMVRERLALIPIHIRDDLAAGPRRGWLTGRAALRDQVVRKLPLVRVPVLVVRGGNDPIVSPKWAVTVARLLPHGRLVTIPEAAHAINFSRPDALMAAIYPFLAE